MSHRLRWATAGVALVATLLILIGGKAEGGAPTPTEKAKQFTDVIAKSPRRPAPSSPPLVMGFFRNGEPRLVELRTETNQVDTPEGTVEEQRTVSTPAEVEAQLGPDDSRKRMAPTPQQIAAMKAAVDARQAALNHAAGRP